jgi:cytochrome P450
MGAHVAQLQVRLTIETLAKRLPTLRLAIPATDVRWSTKAIMRAVEGLPVEW